MNNATMNAGVQISFWDNDPFPLSLYLKMGLLDHTIVLFCIFEEPPYCFS